MAADDAAAVEGRLVRIMASEMDEPTIRLSRPGTIPPTGEKTAVFESTLLRRPHSTEDKEFSSDLSDRSFQRIGFSGCGVSNECCNRGKWEMSSREVR